MPKCGKCGAEIEFYRMATGRVMPVDARPNPNGNLTLVEEGGTKIIEFMPRLKAEDDDGVASDPEDNPYRLTRYVSHFATCTAADFYRKKGIS